MIISNILLKKEEVFKSIKRCLSSNTTKRLLPFWKMDNQKSVGTQDLIGASAAMQSVRMHINQASEIDTNVLITGETGTGKELVANLIHKNSSRAKNHFVCINCTAIPDHLLESELFGHEKGSFTGADALNPGKLQSAEGGTVFLDEIGDMSLYHQAKILRTIENKEIQRVGGKYSIPLNIKIIAATNQDLEQMVVEGKFRKDLYYRLNVANINIPSLRERKEDIPDLLQYFIGKLNSKYQKEIVVFTADAVKDLLCYNWPGNVCEMKNILESSYMNFQTKWITLMDLPENFRTKVIQSRILNYSEKNQLLNALVETNWNKSKVAKQLNWSRMTVYRKIRKYHLNICKASMDL
ncbi:MAG: sigma-54-dependent Fis family transcriptional regulator [Candidatus Kuenenia sp.]|nr:sigma-54-dependent Fis family transcriptional regulator [Candidatus Kuenenia hertensis]